MNDFKRYTVIYLSFVLIFFSELSVFSRKVISSSNQFKVSNSDKSNLAFEFGKDSLDLTEEVRYEITSKDVQIPMLIENRLMDFSVVQVLGVSSPGSGVIIAKKDSSYYVLTNNHVIGQMQEDEEIGIRTIDNNYHIADLIKKDKKIDVALLKFQSNKKYYPAFFDPNTNATVGQKIVLMGYALPSDQVSATNLRKSKGSILSFIRNNIDGYEIMYSNPSNLGMSGGPVYATMPTGFLERNDGNGGSCGWLVIPPLIGIHGRAEAYAFGGKSGANMGIPIHRILKNFQNDFLNAGIKKLPKEEETKLYIEGCPLFTR